MSLSTNIRCYTLYSILLQHSYVEFLVTNEYRIISPVGYILSEWFRASDQPINRYTPLTLHSRSLYIVDDYHVYPLIGTYDILFCAVWRIISRHNCKYILLFQVSFVLRVPLSVSPNRQRANYINVHQVVSTIALWLLICKLRRI